VNLDPTRIFGSSFCAYGFQRNYRSLRRAANDLRPRTARCRVGDGCGSAHSFSKIQKRGSDVASAKRAHLQSRSAVDLTSSIVTPRPSLDSGIQRCPGVHKSACLRRGGVAPKIRRTSPPLEVLGRPYHYNGRGPLCWVGQYGLYPMRRFVAAGSAMRLISASKKLFSRLICPTRTTRIRHLLFSVHDQIQSSTPSVRPMSWISHRDIPWSGVKVEAVQ